MAEYYDYKMAFVDENKNLSEALIEKRLAYEGDEPYNFEIDLVKLDPVLFENLIKKGITTYSIGREDNQIAYCTRWDVDQRIIQAISKHFPEDVFYVSIIYTATSLGDSNACIKNGKPVNKDGFPIFNKLTHLNEKLLKEKEDTFLISIPIGEEPNKWGTFEIPKENVNYTEAIIGDVLYKESIFVYFTTETMQVSFKNGIVEMPIDEIVKKYEESKNSYREDMQSIMEIKDLPAHYFTKREGMNTYYIVKIPCPLSVSENGFISTTLPEYQVNLPAGDIWLGQKGKDRNILIEKNGLKERHTMSNFDIKNYYEEAIFERETNENEEDLEEELE